MNLHVVVSFIITSNVISKLFKACFKMLLSVYISMHNYSFCCSIQTNLVEAFKVFESNALF